VSPPQELQHGYKALHAKHGISDSRTFSRPQRSSSSLCTARPARPSRRLHRSRSPRIKPGKVRPSQDERAAARPYMHYAYVYGTASLAAATPHPLPPAARLEFCTRHVVSKASRNLTRSGSPGVRAGQGTPVARRAQRCKALYLYVYGTASLTAATLPTAGRLAAFPAPQNPHRGRLPVLAGVHPWPPASEELRNPHLRPTARFGRSSHLADWLRRRESLDFHYA
jgi:hypothetical protein